LLAHNQITAPQFWLNVDVIFSLLIYFFRFSKLRKCEGKALRVSEARFSPSRSPFPGTQLLYVVEM
uniref:hypothetical protein n=1 Tax=Blautia sp. TaxID=1955243 RepID=UPI003FF00ECB